jgi:TRAP-type mannitol/chloroaromatic compound transport system substrate-binding protein
MTRKNQKARQAPDTWKSQEEEKRMTFLKSRLGAAAIGGALAATGGLLHAQETYQLDIQTAVPNSSLYFKLTEDFASRVETMSGGRIEVDVLPDGAEVAAFEILDAVDQGVVTAGYAWPHY